MSQPTSPQPHQADSLLGNFLRFLQRPRYTIKVPTQQAAIASGSTAIADLLRLYSLKVIIMLPLMVLQFWVKARLSDVGAIQADSETISLNAFFWYGVVLAPVLEEIMFRLPLRYSPLNLALTFCVWSLFITLTVNLPLPPSQIFVLLVVGSLLLRLGLKKSIHPKAAHRLYQQWFPVLFYGSVLLFGLAHLTNYNFTTVIDQAWTLTPLLVLTQIEGGIFLAFIRLQYGFWWAIFAHSFHNAIVLTLLVLTELSSLDSLLKRQVPTLTSQEDIILLVLLFFVVDGLILCLSTVWGMIQEWRAELQ
ncbi:CPBP family glutamic-type intramembrane protease [Acaryochloris sp. IP29b_bin.148]|uniref:CPBP family glutamic-type intramembrane protease n=1 Tax=Acaryochloris sp. IP29b_bin.148 TaxID=2969218 RepID=UPI0026021B4E|nr:CPBP family glutamic-type intramembrane protease [Acaryochloris sp. IP29b_bin.148]